MDQYEITARRMRRKLHQIPEASMRETATKAALTDFLRTETDLEIVDCGAWFYAAHRAGGDSGFLAFRADFDAVTGEDGISRHLCGHDGHAAVLAAFAKWISDTQPKRNVILLFQPGEESGEGAEICCELFEREKISRIFAFHNIPGHPVGQILLRDGTFACASEGLEIRLTGRPAHAAYPEFGVNPAETMAKIVTAAAEEIRRPHRGMVLSTVIGMEAGSSHYGVSASSGVLRLTLRAETEEEFRSLIRFVRETAQELCEKASVACEFREYDVFPASENSASVVEELKNAAEEAGLPYSRLPEPFRWSEDFGHYLLRTPGAIFGIGSGETCPALHTEHYEFPDDVIPNALAIFRALCEKPEDDR